MSTRFERTKCPAWGLAGGHDAQSGNVTIEAADGTTRTALKDAVQLKTGDRVRIDTGGGGGFGEPRRRARDRLGDDVRKGYVSETAARTIYGLNESAKP
jgi:N-methylhydantoinase B